MDISIFPEKLIIPTSSDLESVLNDQYELWMQIREFVFEKYPKAVEEWNFPGKKYGWSFRIKDKRRAIIYFLPRDGFFKVAFVFGQKATSVIMESDISEKIKADLASARVYAEGRGVQVIIEGAGSSLDVKKLIEIKLAN